MSPMTLKKDNIPQLNSFYSSLGNLIPCLILLQYHKHPVFKNEIVTHLFNQQS